MISKHITIIHIKELLKITIMWIYEITKYFSYQNFHIGISN